MKKLAKTLMMVAGCFGLASQSTALGQSPVGESFVQAAFETPSVKESATPIRSQIQQDLGPGEVLLEPGQRVPTAAMLAKPPQPGVPELPYAGSGVLPADCGMGCNPAWVGSVEAFWLDRPGDKFFTMSRSIQNDGFGYELGGRLTIGRKWDCTEGWEVSFTGPFRWNMNGVALVNGIVPASNFRTDGGYVPAQIDAFTTATGQSQEWVAKFQNWEINRRSWAWDVFSVTYGARFIDYKENYTFLTTGPNGDGGYQQNLRNFLGGFHIGADYFYPVSQRILIGAKGKAGVFANFNEGNTFMVNNNNVLLNAFDENVDLAGLLEIGVSSKYKVTSSISLTAGYEVWYLAGVATIPEQNIGIISPSSGTTISSRDDLFLHGGTAGVEIIW